MPSRLSSPDPVSQLDQEFEHLRRAISALIAAIRATGQYDAATIANAEVDLHWGVVGLQMAVRRLNNTSQKP